MKESEIIDAFISSGKIKGEFKREFSVGYFFLPETADKYEDYDKHLNKAYRVFLKQIDLLVENEEEVWIIECKDRINPASVGQLLLYKFLYEKDHPKEERAIKLGILYVHKDRLVEAYCRSNQIHLFEIS